MNHQQLAWLAGLLEGEGWFIAHSTYKHPSIGLKMTDYDVVEHAASLMDTNISHRGIPSGGTKEAYQLQIYGTRAAKLMRELYPLMGMRRKTQIAEVLGDYTGIEPSIVFGLLDPERRPVALEKLKAYTKDTANVQQLVPSGDA